MKETRCPFLETKTVTFCKAFPSKMIPVDRMSSSGGLCNSCDFEECSLYSEVRGVSARGCRMSADSASSRSTTTTPSTCGSPRTTEEKSRPGWGSTTFPARLIGRIDRASVPAVGVAVKENHVCFLLHSGHRTVHLVAPADGVVQAVNPKVSADPSILNEDPYGDGWIFSMQLKGDAVKGLYHENVARKWYESEVERLQRVFSSDLGMLATDGGRRSRISAAG